MAGTISFDDLLTVPLGIQCLEEFRHWALSDSFPESGRIDYINGDIEVEMSPENLFYHGTLKLKLAAEILARVEELQLGHVLTDATRVSSIEAQLSAEPDIVVLSQRAIEDGRVRLIPAASGATDSYVEVEGGPDLIVEIVSDSSVRKDTTKLPAAYFAAGVEEFWLVDARGDELRFEIQRRGGEQFQPALISEDGFQRSGVLGNDYRLERSRGLGGFWQYRLAARP